MGKQNNSLSIIGMATIKLIVFYLKVIVHES